MPLKSSNSNQNTGPYNRTKRVELSSRELEILHLLIKGHTNKNIAEQLFISTHTAKRHTENIYRKLQVHNRIGLFQKAKQQKII